VSTSPPNWGFIRLKALLAPIGPLPFGRSTFLRGVKEGRFPAPVRIGPNAVAWRVADILELIDRLSAGNDPPENVRRDLKKPLRLRNGPTLSQTKEKEVGDPPSPPSADPGRPK
jgi:prophage regulatory protein